jgi:hypothetical protein
MQNDECRMQNEEQTLFDRKDRFTTETRRHGEEKREKKFSACDVSSAENFPGGSSPWLGASVVNLSFSLPRSPARRGEM